MQHISEEKLKKWQLLGQFLAGKTNNTPTNLHTAASQFADFLSKANGSSATSQSKMTLEVGFGIFLIVCGVVAVVSNVLILLAICRHLRYRNALFIIITNFALVDELKALSAIYMGSVLVSVAFTPQLHFGTNEPNQQYLLVFKMLQISVFMMYFGNLCSVFNLILATINEFLYIKVPLRYSRLVTGCRVSIAILTTWVLALLFSLGKWLIGKGGHQGRSSVLTPIDSNSTYVQSSGNTSGLSHTLLRVQSGPARGDVYNLILISCLLVCLLIIGMVYINLYLTIRRSNAFRAAVTVRKSPRSEKSHGSNMSTPVLERWSTEPSLRIVARPQDNHQLAQKLLATQGSSDSSSSKKTVECSVFGPEMSPSNSSTASIRILQRTKSNKNVQFTPPDTKTGNPEGTGGSKRGERMFKRMKCLLVIMTVCAVNFIYLAVYFCVLLLHQIYITGGITKEALQSRYVINFVLRALFVLHACLNPLILTRIRSFKAAFLLLVADAKCCCKGEMPATSPYYSGLNNSFRVAERTKTRDERDSLRKVVLNSKYLAVDQV